MKKGLTLLIFAAILAFAGIAKAEEFIIEGYQPEEFAVKGVIEEQVKSLAAEIRKKYGSNKELHIAVIGSADITGRTPDNDKLAGLRAEQVAAVLSHEFPNARINFWSEGEGKNVRQVAVKCNLTPFVAPVASASEVQNKNAGLGAFRIIVIAIAIILAGIFMFCLASRKFDERRKERKTASSFRNIEVILDEKKYSVSIEQKDGKFYSPFKTLEDSSKYLFREKFQDIKKAVKGCMKNPRYALQRNELIKRGVIKTIS